MNRISFIILHYLDFGDTIECIESIERLDSSGFEIRIVLVDNGSNNDSFSKLKDYYQNEKRIVFIQNEENLGFAKGNNVGYKSARLSGSEFIVILNSDTVIMDIYFIKRIETDYYEHKYYVMGPDIITLDGIHQNPIDGNYDAARCRRIIRDASIMYLCELFGINIIRRKLRAANRNVKTTIIQKTDSKINAALHGAFLVFSPLFIRESDVAFYPNTFLYMEENILYYLCQRKGYTTYYDSNVSVLHKEDVTAKLMMKSNRKRMMFTFKNQRKSAKEFLKLMNNDELCTFLDR